MALKLFIFPFLPVLLYNIINLRILNLIGVRIKHESTRRFSGMDFQIGFKMDYFTREFGEKKG